MTESFMNIAHRGFSGRYPENTLASFRAAVELGCGWMELDVRRTADGAIVVIHDKTVDRTTNGTGDVSAMTWDELRSLDAGSWKGAEFAGERIPSLEEVLTLVNGRAQVVIELKLPTEHVPEVIEVVRRCDAFGWTLTTAFEWETILAVRNLVPQWRTAWLTNMQDLSTDDAIARCAEAGVTQISSVCGATDEELVKKAHAAGLLVRCWGVGNDKGDEMRRLISMGVDGMTTNHPDILQTILNDMK